MEMYKIEIWVWHNCINIFKSDNLQDVLDWYNEKYKYSYENGGCTFYLFKNNEEMSFQEECNLGFHE